MMHEATALLEQQLRSLNRPVLKHGGSIKHDTAERHVELQYARFDNKRREERRNQANKELAALKEADKGLPKTRRAKKR
jgi:hypothetical protein